jgi:arylsulfatase A-like enzyme
MRFSFLATAVCFMFPLSPGATVRPNIVFILADDLGIGDVECYGRDRCAIETPHLDSLARDGMRFTDAHCVASVCVPSRIAIMTGRYPWRFQPPRPDGPWGFLNPRLRTDTFTLGRMLQQSDYRTGYVGKWHLGTLMQTTDGNNQGPTNVDYTKPLQVGPPNYGFDESYILPGSLDMFPYAFVRNGEFVGSVTAQKGWSAFNRVGPAAEDFEDVKVLDTFSTQAEQFIGAATRANRAQQPFFLYLALTAPHTPISPSRDFEGKSELGLYGDFVMETDHCVGRVLAALKEHGIEDNTIVMASSDHGAGAYAGNIRKATPGQLKLLEQQGHYASGIYRGYKFSIYEGGLRVPLLVRWPAVVKAGSECHRLVGLIDLLRTCAEAGNGEVPEDAAVDSVSLLPLLRDPKSPPVRETFVMQSTRAFAIRSGQWKLALCPGSGCPGVYGNTPTQNDAWKDAITAFGKPPRSRDDLQRAPFVQLFNMDADPSETNNLAAEHPSIVRELINVLEEQIAKGRSTPGPAQMNDRQRIDYFAGVPREVLRKLQP